MIQRSEVFSAKHTSHEAIFVFSSISFLVQPIPTLIGSLIGKISDLQKILNTHLGLIVFFGITGSLQWWLIGFGMARYIDSKGKTGILDKLNLSVLCLLALTFISYTVSLLFLNLGDLRGLAEKSFVILWVIFVILLPINLVKILISRATRKL